MNLHKNPTPARLEKKERSHWHSMTGVEMKVRFWTAKYAGVLLIALILMLLALFVLICMIVVPPVESGVYYNHLMEGNL